MRQSGAGVILSKEQKIQEEQYDFPYHYIPKFSEDDFSMHRYWSWSLRYVGGLLVTMSFLDELKASGEGVRSVIDIGCGDGRFLHELHARHPELDLEGVDYSQRAITLARAFNPDLKFGALDIRTQAEPRRRDVATMIEVLEHIAPSQVSDFLVSVARHLRLGGNLILTVPHTNKPVSNKHFQHFDADGLREILAPIFEVTRVQPFDDVRSTALKLLLKVLGGNGTRYLITHRATTRALYRLYRSRFLFLNGEARCGRIGIVARRVG